MASMVIILLFKKLTILVLYFLFQSFLMHVNPNFSNNLILQDSTHEKMKWS